MDRLWLGYDGLDLPFPEVAAVLIYRPAFDGRIASTCGFVPAGVRSVVVTSDGRYFPARWRAEQIRQRWALWRSAER